MPLYFGLPVVVLSPLAFLSRPARWLRAFHRYRGTIGAAPNFAYELAAAKISDEEMQGSRLERLARGAERRGARSSRDAGSLRGAIRSLRFPPRNLCRLRPGGSVAGGDDSSGGTRAARGPPRPRRICARRPRGSGAPSRPGFALSEDPNVISFVSVGRARPAARSANRERPRTKMWANASRDSSGFAGLPPRRATIETWPRRPLCSRRAPRPAGSIPATAPIAPDGEIYITGRVKDIIIHAGHNLYPHEIEDAVARVPGVRKGCVVAFGAADPVAGTERLVIVAESRERNRDARARIAQAITAQVTETLGLPPNVVEVVPPNAIPKTSSGKLRRDATKKRFLSGELGSAAPPVWLQIARLRCGIGRRANPRALRRARGSGVRLLRHRDVRAAVCFPHGCLC